MQRRGEAESGAPLQPLASGRNGLHARRFRPHPTSRPQGKAHRVRLHRDGVAQRRSEHKWQTLGGGIGAVATHEETQAVIPGPWTEEAACEHAASRICPSGGAAASRARRGETNAPWARPARTAELAGRPCLQPRLARGPHSGPRSQTTAYGHRCTAQDARYRRGPVGGVRPRRRPLGVRGRCKNVVAAERPRSSAQPVCATPGHAQRAAREPRSS